ncbi:putative membrane protein [Wickerhamomyces ciferrii]|uniref:Membrane protein n=1 Tax=Wickerhamomyces ciferrii (strain ATCC 14091 / BCRC 22168 / CBS 111 / JCM 3599 / NBRC 0793 / NRRL Y-1031 F-60-10) TaxID=1206466 RepID=K0KVZ3_WICCF|nr:uncharacterized protein BN7_5259 [Wickerhamomyces ciferrii]CCH45674.1 putative membrane protein [Wickerhamomyces ciferrii]
MSTESFKTCSDGAESIELQELEAMEESKGEQIQEINKDVIKDDTTVSDLEKQSPQPTPPKDNTPYSAFSQNRKNFIVGLVTMAGFLGPVSGNIYIPILPLLQDVFKCSETTINATVSVFMAIFAIAPLLWASWADFGGRKLLYLTSLVFFLISNILLASLPPNIGALFVLRIVQAFGASSVMSVGAGTVADIVEPKDRAKAISYFMLGPQLGPILGPILSIIASNGSWRWIFGFLAIYGGVVYLLIIFLLPETLRYLVGNGEIYNQHSKSILNWFIIPKHLKQPKLVQDSPKYPKPPKPSLKNYYRILKYKPVLLCSINAGLLFATFYGMSVTFTRILQENYGFTNLQRSLAYICPGASLISGSLIGGRLSDKLRRYLIQKNPETYVPENRFSLQIFGLLISMIGVLGYGWLVDKKVHVSAVFVFTFLGGFGMTWVFVTTTTYLTECSTRQPATNVAIGNFFRNSAAAISSVLIDILIKKMGFGWCFTGLALIDLIGLVFVIILMIKGPKWRKEWEKSLNQH